MTLFKLLLIVGTVLALSIGQLMFKLASSNIILTFSGLLNAFFDFRIILALTIYGGATASWLYVLKTTDLKTAYPFAGLAFIIIPVLSKIFLGEETNIYTFIGAIIIMIGVIVSSYR